MGLKTTAISSMNYFFLRTLAGKMDEDVVNDELNLFLHQLREELPALDEASRSAIQKELLEGGYLNGVPAPVARRMLDVAIIKLTTGPMPEVTQFYMNLLIEGQRLGADTR